MFLFIYDFFLKKYCYLCNNNKKKIKNKNDNKNKNNFNDFILIKENYKN